MAKVRSPWWITDQHSLAGADDQRSNQKDHRGPGPLQRTHAIPPPIREDRRRSLYHEGDCIGYATILGLDLGKFKSVCCMTDVANKTHAFETIQNTPQMLREFLSKYCGADPSGVLLVIETCDTAGLGESNREESNREASIYRSANRGCRGRRVPNITKT